MTNELTVDVSKYKTETRTLLAGLLRKQIPCNLPGAIYNGLADTVALSSRGVIFIARTGGKDLKVSWERTEGGNKRVWWEDAS
jgi:hypothetical protein